MADKDFELEDPFEPVAVALSTPGYDGMGEMGRCFVEEYALMGWAPDRIFKLFTIPEFAGSYAIYQERGPQYVRNLIHDVFGEQFVEEPEREAVQMIPVNRRPHAALPNKGDSDAPGL
jgi:hypothetical protein